MALRLTGVTPSPLLDQPALTADGDAARLRTYTGEIHIAQDSGFLMYVPSQIDAVPMGFVPPDATAMRPGDEPRLAAEITLAQILPAGSGDSFNGAGATAVTVALQPDQNDPTWAWPYLSFQALGIRPMVLRYRVTVLTSEAPPESG